VADIIEVDDVADAPLTAVKYLITEPRAVTRHHRPMSSKTCAACRHQHLAVVAAAAAAAAVVVAALDGVRGRYL